MDASNLTREMEDLTLMNPPHMLVAFPTFDNNKLPKKGMSYQSVLNNRPFSHLECS